MFKVEIQQQIDPASRVDQQFTMVRADMRRVTDIGQAQNGRVELEKAIVALCTAYEAATGLPVSNISVSYEKFGESAVHVEVRV